jgi:regulator of protease activity HflC (stomatin/prohibitin superfamily)
MLTLFLAVVAVAVAVFLVSGIKVIQQSQTVVVERLGRYDRTLDSGVNVLIPVFDRPRRIQWRHVDDTPQGAIVRKISTGTIDLREQVYDFPRQNVITRDNVLVEINAMLYFQITDAKRAVYEIADLPNAIEKLTQTSLRNVAGEMDLDELLSSRDKVNTSLRAILDDATDKWGVKVNRVEIQDITPPADVRHAMEKQMRAERDKRAAILESEGQKQSAILAAEGQREALVTSAEGRKRAQILEAEAQAEARLKVARAEAEAIAQIRGALGGTPQAATGYLVAERYIEALTRMVQGNGEKVVLLPYEATALMGSLGSMRELFGATTEPRRTPEREGLEAPRAVRPASAAEPAIFPAPPAGPNG